MAPEEQCAERQERGVQGKHRAQSQHALEELRVDLPEHAGREEAYVEDRERPRAAGHGNHGAQVRVRGGREDAAQGPLRQTEQEHEPERRSDGDRGAQHRHAAEREDDRAAALEAVGQRAQQREAEAVAQAGGRAAERRLCGGGGERSGQRVLQRYHHVERADGEQGAHGEGERQADARFDPSRADRARVRCHGHAR
jgi:hypothetical protein